MRTQTHLLYSRLPCYGGPVQHEAWNSILQLEFLDFLQHRGCKRKSLTERVVILLRLMTAQRERERQREKEFRGCKFQTLDPPGCQAIVSSQLPVSELEIHLSVVALIISQWITR